MPFELLLPCLALLFGCGVEKNSENHSKIKALSDVNIMQQFPDGGWEVVCKDGSYEVVYTDHLKEDNVCPFLPEEPTDGARVLRVRSFSYNGPAGEVASFGTFNSTLDSLDNIPVYEGFITFKLSIKKGTEPQISIKDGNNKTWDINMESNILSFSKLKLPVTIKSKSEETSIKLSNIIIHQSKPTIFSHSGKNTKSISLGTIGESLNGSLLDIRVKLRLFDNYTDDGECVKFEFRGKDRKIAVGANNPQTNIKGIKAPVEIFKEMTCNASRLQQPENASEDYELEFETHFNWKVNR